LTFTEQVLDAIRKNALANAFRHGGKPDAGATLGRTLSEYPELKQSVKELMKEVVRVCGEVGNLSPQQ
jgi:hypothetical protein